VVLLCALAALVGGCQGDLPSAAPSDDGGRLRAEVEYQLLQAELQLAGQTRAYLVFDWPADEVVIKMRGAPVARLSMTLQDDDLAVRRFQQRFLGDDRRAVRGVALRRLYSSQGLHPDSILAIVGQVLKVDPHVLQRQVPGRFELGWGDGAVLEVRTDIDDIRRAESVSRWRRFRATIAGVVDGPGAQAWRCGFARLLGDAGVPMLHGALVALLGESRLSALRATIAGQCRHVRLRVRMEREDALALYRVAQPGAPTLLPITF
jgi:hypothetical protein